MNEKTKEESGGSLMPPLLEYRPFSPPITVEENEKAERRLAVYLKLMAPEEAIKIEVKKEATEERINRSSDEKKPLRTRKEIAEEQLLFWEELKREEILAKETYIQNKKNRLKAILEPYQKWPEPKKYFYVVQWIEHDIEQVEKEFD